MSNDHLSDSSDAKWKRISRGPPAAVELRALELWKPLMDRLEERTGRKIKSHWREFTVSLSFIWVRVYTREKERDERAIPKKLLLAHEELIQHFEHSRRLLESVLDDVLYLFGEDVLKLAPHLELMMRLKNDHDEFCRFLREDLDDARKHAAKYRRGGRPPRIAIKVAIRLLAGLYEKDIGLRPGVSSEIDDGGPFVDFVRAYLGIIEPDAAKRSQLAATVKDVLRDRRAGGEKYLPRHLQGGHTTTLDTPK